MKMARVTSLGEVLIDFTPSGKSDRGRLLYECNPGGAPANMLSCLAQFGHECSMIACVGADAFGNEIVKALEGAGVNCRNVLRSKDAPTTLAVVSLNEQGDRSFSFYRDNCADISIRPEDITEEMLAGIDLLHVGSLSLTHEPVRSATFHLVQMAREKNIPISYDPNDRPLLWKNREEAPRQMKALLPVSDIVKMSDEEAVFLTNIEDIDAAAAQILRENANIRALFVTCGADGSAYYLPSGAKGKVSGLSGAEIVDTTGAGDYFFAGALARLLEEDFAKPFSEAAVREACAQGNECGYRVAQVRGALGVRVR